jgi:hypothetical protein
MSYVDQISAYIGAAFIIMAASYAFKFTIAFSFAEATYIGLSMGYVVITAINSAIDVASPIMAGKPELVIPLLLALLYYMRLVPRLQHLSRWPVAILVGIGLGLVMPRGLTADILSQAVYIASRTITGGDLFQNFNNLLIVVMSISSLVYFLFTIEHKGPVGWVARFGRLCLYAMFGAGFGAAVLGRITQFIGVVTVTLGNLGLSGIFG